MINLLDLNLDEITKFVISMDEPKFRASQLYNAILNGKEFSESSVLPKDFLDKISNRGAKMQALKIHKSLKSKDKTIKFLFKLLDDNIIEGVLMQYKFGKTLCISTQVGCKMNCAFCASGLNFVRNLTAGEILGQVVAVNSYLKGTLKERQITNIVLMGAGEPLDNFDNVVKFLQLVTNENGFNFSVRNITLSTCGIPSKIEKLADLGLNINLAISLHASNNATRKEIMPVAKSYNIESIIESAKYYEQITSRRIIIEYALIDGINDSLENARELSHRLENLSCHVNLIRLNDVKERGLMGVSENKMYMFLRELIKCGISATVRRSLGDDIEGACGQLRNRELNGNAKVNSNLVSANKTNYEQKTSKFNKFENNDRRNYKESSIDNGKKTYGKPYEKKYNPKKETFNGYSKSKLEKDNRSKTNAIKNFNNEIDKTNVGLKTDNFSNHRPRSYGKNINRNNENLNELPKRNYKRTSNSSFENQNNYGTKTKAYEQKESSYNKQKREYGNKEYKSLGAKPKKYENSTNTFEKRKSSFGKSQNRTYNSKFSTKK